LLPCEGRKRGGRAGAASVRVREGGVEVEDAQSPAWPVGLPGFDCLGPSVKQESRGTTLL